LVTLYFTVSLLCILQVATVFVIVWVLCLVILLSVVPCLLIIPGVAYFSRPLVILSSSFVPDYLSPVFQPCLCEFLFNVWLVNVDVGCYWVRVRVLHLVWVCSLLNTARAALGSSALSLLRPHHHRYSINNLLINYVCILTFN